MQHGDVVFDDSCFTNHQAGGMVNHDPTADDSGRVNINSEDLTDSVLEKEGECGPSLTKEPVSNPIGLDGMKAFKVEQGD